MSPKSRQFWVNKTMLKAKIGTCQAQRGKMARGELHVATDPKAGSIAIPIAIARGYEEGPILFLSAGVHGDELNGIVILQRFMQNLDVAALRGTIVFLPLVNGAGFEAGRREVPYDGRDLNRCFPGDALGSASEQIAHTIFTEVIARCDFGIDVHDSGRSACFKLLLVENHPPAGLLILL